MATHECRACLKDMETIQGATKVYGNLVLANSACSAPGDGRHTWVRKYQIPGIDDLEQLFIASVF